MDSVDVLVRKLPGTERLQDLASEYYERRLLRRIKRRGNLPQHVGIILDGNRRFAREKGLSRKEGHAVGAEKMEEVLEWAQELGIKHGTVYAFSKENLSRSPEEIKELMDIFSQKFREIADDRRVHKNKIRVRALGDTDLLPKRVRSAIEKAEEATRDYDEYTLNIAIGYGGRGELTEAAREICERVKAGDLEPTDVDEDLISDYLYTQDLPDPDLIIRTSGEERLSGFLLWQSAYSDLNFCETYWPAFTKIDFLRAISTYQKRKQRSEG